MRSALLLSAGLAAFVALAAPARAANDQPCQNTTPPAPAKIAPCSSAPCLWTPHVPCSP